MCAARRRRRGIGGLCECLRGLAADYRFAPGQYLTLRTTMDGEEMRRSYSICSGPDDGELRIAVKKIDGGAFSSWAADELKAGDELDVMTPTGRFGIAHEPDRARIYVGMAAGSGITPILSIAKGVLAREPHSRFFLLYGNRSTGGMLFREALEELKDRFMQRLSVFHVISGEEQDIPILHGRLDGEKVRVLLRSLVPASSVDHVFICGPTGMGEESRRAASTSAWHRTEFMWSGSSRASAANRVRRLLLPRPRRRRRWPRWSLTANAARCRSPRARRSSTPRCAPASTCRSPARAACARLAAPSWSRAKRGWR